MVCGYMAKLSFHTILICTMHCEVYGTYITIKISFWQVEGMPDKKVASF